VSYLYLVNAVTGSVREWPSAVGSSQPVVYPNAKALFYRRGIALFKETIGLTQEDVSAMGSPRRFEGVVFSRLYASNPKNFR